MPRTTTHHFWRSSALPFVESRRASDSAACYAPHSHSTLSIGAVDSGESVFSRNGQRQKLVRGDVVRILDPKGSELARGICRYDHLELDRLRGSTCAADFRDRLGVGRKLAIQILEYFDRIGFTRRRGNDHLLRDALLFPEK